MARAILKVANGCISLIVILFLLVAGVYAGYALWDNNRIYSAAENVQADMIKLKPTVITAEDTAPSFEELLAINPDVCGWITLENTKIDYPILQGKTNLDYINTDVYGNFALAGSIFLDTRNDNSLTDAYSLLYGHHMENSGMFGDLDLYKDKDFFNSSTTGTLISLDGVYELEIFACLLVSSSDSHVFEPQRWRDDIDGLLPYINENALHTRENATSDLETTDAPKILAMSTCSSEFTDARTILLALMHPSKRLEETK